MADVEVFRKIRRVESGVLAEVVPIHHSGRCSIDNCEDLFHDDQYMNVMAAYGQVCYSPLK